MVRPIEPGLLRLFRYFAGVAMVYFVVLWGYGVSAPDRSLTLQVQSLANFATNSCLFIYLSISWLERHLRAWYLPLAIMAYTGVTVVSNLIYLLEPGPDLSVIVTRSWTLVPILLVPLVLIAWQYSFRYVLLFTVLTNAIELAILFPVVGQVDFETLPILGLPLIRAFAFGTVGYIVVRLMDRQRRQKRTLIRTNLLLGQHAHTLEHLATSRERNRLARELHDTLAHTLSGVAVNLEAIKTLLAPGQVEVSSMLDHSLQAVRLGLDETRRALQDLRARPLEDLGLELALGGLVRAVAERESIETETTIAADLPALPPDVEQSIYRISQEALENAARYSHAGRLSLDLQVLDGRLQLTVADDGDGFDPRRVEADRQFGLQGMQERAAIVGGTLSVHSLPGSGTTVRFCWEKPDDQDLDL